MSIRNLDFLRGVPDIGQRLYETLSDIISQQQQLAQQFNGSTTSQPESPPSIDALTVTGQNGHFNVAIHDNNPNLYRGVRYYVEHDSDPQFTNPQVVQLGDARNSNLFLGSGTRYFRAYSAYIGSAPSEPKYHGSAAEPKAVEGGGAIGEPEYQASQGSGTGPRGVGMQGPGVVPFRGDGRPPTR